MVFTNEIVTTRRPSLVTWSYWAGAGGVPLLVLLFYGMRRARGIVEMWLAAHLAAQAEREQCATMVAMAQSLPDGGAAARPRTPRPPCARAGWRGWRPGRTATAPLPGSRRGTAPARAGSGAATAAPAGGSPCGPAPSGRRERSGAGARSAAERCTSYPARPWTPPGATARCVAPTARRARSGPWRSGARACR